MAFKKTSTPLIYPKTATETVTFELTRADLPARLSASGLAGSEKVTIKTIDGEGTTEAKVQLYKDGAVNNLTLTNPVVALDAPGPYECTKDATAGASGLYLHKG